MTPVSVIQFYPLNPHPKPPNLNPEPIIEKPLPAEIFP